MADEPKVPVKLADCGVGDYVVLRYRGKSDATLDNWRLVKVLTRTPKSITVVGSVGKFMTTGRPFGLANRRYYLFDPSPDVLEKVAETAARQAAADAARAAAEAEKQAEDEANARRAAAWLAGKTAAELLAFLPTYALGGLWETIEPRLTEKPDAVPEL